MRSRRHTAPFLLLLTALLAPRPAAAGDEPGAPAPAQDPAQAAPAADAKPAAATSEERAALLYEEGNKFYDEGKYKEAEAKYQAAWDMARSFDIAGNLGNVEMMIGQPREAAEHLAYALKIFPLGGAPEKRKFLQGRLADAKKQIGTLRISVNMAGAEVFVDEKSIGKSPIETDVFVDPGDRIVVARYGEKTTEQTVVVAKGSAADVPLTIETGPNMGIVLGGAAVGVAGIGAGVVFAILSNGKAGDAEAATRGSDERNSLRDDQTLFGNISFWSFVGGGAVLAGTAIYALTAGGVSGEAAAPPSGLRAAPIVTAKGGGLMIGGTW
jgi:hypothetical protein